MAPIDRRDRVSLAAGGLALAGALTIACALVILHLVAVLSGGAAALTAGTMILVAQRRLGRRLHESGRG
jgi:hypothetical protein